MKSTEFGIPNFEKYKGKLNQWLIIATLGIVLLLASCGPTEASNDPLTGPDVIHAYSAETWDGTNFVYGPNSGQFDVRMSPDGITETSLVKPSTLCDSELTRNQIDLCNAIDSLASVMGMSETETSDLRGRTFVVDIPTKESLHPTSASGLTILEYRNNQITGKGFIVFPENVPFHLSPLAHEYAHVLKNEGLLNLAESRQSNTLILGNENISEDLSCVKIQNEVATVCLEVEPGRTTCSSGTINELRADTFANIITARAAACTAENWNAVTCGQGEYAGYLWETQDASSVLTRDETARLMQNMRIFYLNNPSEFDAWVETQRSGEFTQSWTKLFTAYGLDKLTPEQSVHQLLLLDASINAYSGAVGSPITHSDQGSIQEFCQQ